MNVDREAEKSILNLFSSSSYVDALVELRGWPEGVARWWYEASCYFYLEDFANAEKILTYLNAIDGFPVEVPLRLAVSLQCQGRLAAALAILLPVFSRNRREPDASFVVALIQYGNICLEMGLASHFLAVASKFRSLVGRSAELQLLEGLSFLFVGNFRQGWSACETRFKIGWGSLPVLSVPLLTSDSISKCKDLAIFAELGQGLGDVFWGMRCVVLLRNLGIRLSLVAPEVLTSFMVATDLFDQVVNSFEDLSVNLTHFLPIMSLPSVLGLNSPCEMPNPDIDLRFPEKRMFISSRFSDGISKGCCKPIVALNWQGNKSQEGPTTGGIRGRSFSFSEFEKISALKDCCLISVQVGETAHDIDSSSLRDCFHPAQSLLNRPGRDFLVTADALLQSDLLITNDTSVAHLGGLLNIPTWVVLKCFPYWQWREHGQHNVWYPSIRCFRQHRPGDWQSAMEDVNSALTSLLHDQMLPPEIPESPGL